MKPQYAANVDYAPLAPVDERPLTERPDLPDWTENYLMQAYDPTADIGFWLHVGLPIYDFDLWHDITVVYLPGGVELLLGKGFGARSESSDVSASMLTSDYDELSGDWIWRFRGAGMRVDRHDLAKTAAIDGRAQPLSFELRARGMSAVRDMKSEVSDQPWADAHWEQPLLVDGWVDYDGQRLEFHGAGVRDHSRGPRDFVSMGPHYWLHGQFPSGRAFGLAHVEPTSAQPQLLSSAYLVEGGILDDATVVSVPDDPTFTGPFDIVLEGPRGEERIRGELLHDMTFSMEYPNEILFGYRSGRPQHLLREGQVRWTWNGEVGYGLGERTELRAADGSPDIR